MTPERWQQLKQIFQSALERNPAERDAFLSQACADDPVLRSEIESIRGVKAGPMLRTLLSHKLVRVTGRADVPGRPLQYGTTQQFLDRFGLASLQDLPELREFKQLG